MNMETVARLLLLILLFAGVAHGQVSVGDFQPSQTAASPLQIRVADGSVGGGVMGTYKMLATNLLLTASATNYVYLNLSVTPPVLTVNTTGFPASQYYPIATVDTGPTQYTSLADSRPGVNLNPAGSGGGSGSWATTIDASLPPYSVSGGGKACFDGTVTNA